MTCVKVTKIPLSLRQYCSKPKKAILSSVGQEQTCKLAINIEKGEGDVGLTVSVTDCGLKRNIEK